MNDNGRPTTIEDIKNETQFAQGYLSSIENWRNTIRIAYYRHMHAEQPELDLFIQEAINGYNILTMKWVTFKDATHLNFIKFANAGYQQPLRYDTWMTATAHEMAHALIITVLACCVPPDGMLELESEGEKHQEIENLVEQAKTIVTDEFIKELKVRVDIERDIAMRWHISNKLAAESLNHVLVSADKPKLFPRGLPPDSNVRDLAIEIDAEQRKPKRERRSNNQIAREFTNGTNLKPDSLLRQVSRWT